MSVHHAASQCLLHRVKRATIEIIIIDVTIFIMWTLLQALKKHEGRSIGAAFE